jgi:hypothetical protein
LTVGGKIADVDRPAPARSARNRRRDRRARRSGRENRRSENVRQFGRASEIERRRDRAERDRGSQNAGHRRSARRPVHSGNRKLAEQSSRRRPSGSSAEANVEKQIQQTRDIAAQAVAGSNATVDTSASAPGVAILNGVRDHVQSAMNAAKPQIGAIENQLGTQNTRGPGGGSAMVDVRGLVNDLQAMKTTTDAAGNVRATVAPEIAARIDAEIASLNRARQPENAALDVWMQSNINRAQAAPNDPQTPAQAIPMLQCNSSRRRRPGTPTSRSRSRRCAR